MHMLSNQQTFGQIVRQRQNWLCGIIPRICHSWKWDDALQESRQERYGMSPILWNQSRWRARIHSSISGMARTKSYKRAIVSPKESRSRVGIIWSRGCGAPTKIFRESHLCAITHDAHLIPKLCGQTSLLLRSFCEQVFAIKCYIKRFRRHQRPRCHHHMIQLRLYLRHVPLWAVVTSGGCS